MSETIWRVEWYKTADGKTPVRDAVADLRKGVGTKAIAKIERQVLLLQDVGLAGKTDLVKKVRGDLWELRATFQRNPYRFLFYDRGNGVLVLLHFFHKKDDAILQSDIDRAAARMDDDRKRR